MMRPLRLSRMCEDQLDQSGHAEQIHLELLLRLGQGHVLERPVGAVLSVVDEDINPSGVGDDTLDTCRDGVFVGHGHRKRVNALRLQIGHPIDTACDLIDRVSALL